MRKLAPLLTVGVVTVAMLASSIGAAQAVSQTGGNQGCTPGYWKNHLDNWPGADPADDDYGNPGALPGAILDSKFGNLSAAGLGSFYNDTLEQALNFQGGPGLNGAAQILFRAAAAAWLNAADDRMSYIYPRFSSAAFPVSIHSLIAPTLGNRDQMLAVATILDNANNAVGGCPLN